MTKKTAIGLSIVILVVLISLWIFYFLKPKDIKTNDSKNEANTSQSASSEKTKSSAVLVPYQNTISTCGLVMLGTKELVGKDEYNDCRILTPDLFLLTEQTYSTDTTPETYQYNVVNSDLKTVYSTKDQLTHVFDNYLAFKPFNEEYKSTVIDFSGNVILDSQPFKIISLSRRDISFPLAVEKKFSQTNYVTREGKFLLKEDMRESYDFFEGVAAVDTRENGIFIQKYINLQGEFINTESYYYNLVLSSRRMSDGLMFTVLDKDRRLRRFIDSKGGEVFKLDDQSIASDFKNGFAIVQKMNPKFSPITVIDKQGNTVKTLDIKGEMNLTKLNESGLVYISGETNYVINTKGDTILTLPKPKDKLNPVSVLAQDDVIILNYNDDKITSGSSDVTMLYNLKGEALLKNPIKGHFKKIIKYNDIILLENKFFSKFGYYDSNGFIYLYSGEADSRSNI